MTDHRSALSNAFAEYLPRVVRTVVSTLEVVAETSVGTREVGAIALEAGRGKVVRKALQDLHVHTLRAFAPVTGAPDDGAFATDSEVRWATALRAPRVLEPLVEGSQIFEYSVALGPHLRRRRVSTACGRRLS